MKANSLAQELLHRMNACWRVLNRPSVGQLHLYGHSLLMQLRMSERVGPLEFNHWSATPGRNLIRLHLKWIINNYDLAMFDVASPSLSCRAVAENAGRKTTC